ncbi:MAG: hypothetical protein LKG11_07090 [Bacilli bacterium]|nr:hypothetical protein [Bacilli bacterium]
MELTLSVISLVTSISGIVFAFLAFRRNEKSDRVEEGKHEGTMTSDIGYIKACVDRVEKSLSVVDERYRCAAERLAKLEESVKNAEKRIDELCGKKEINQ